MALVYLITNLVNGKRYVGKTSGKSAGRRWNAHKSSARKGAPWPLSQAIRKYGADLFRISVLKECPTDDLALVEEIRLIAILEPEYNVTSGGDGAAGVRLSEERKRNISVFNRAYYAANKHPSTGTVAPRDRVDRQRSSRIGKKHVFKDLEAWKKANAPSLAKAIEARRRPVRCLWDGKMFPDISSSADYYGVSASMITTYLNGTRDYKCVRGLTFEYLLKEEYAAAVARPWFCEKVA